LVGHSFENAHPELNHIQIMGVLTILLEKVTDIVDTDALGKSDPYVKMTLEQDNFGVFRDQGYGAKTSSKKSNTKSPVFNETFTFSDLPSLNNMVIHCKIMDDDIGFDDKLGSCKIKLESLGLNETPKEFEYCVDKNLIKMDGIIHLKLSYK
jgi:Ca2+-dependent lipid-binding protein